MRVKKVQIFEHPGLGDLEVDFTVADGSAARLVVLAGENGCGKTVILETIFSALSHWQAAGEVLDKTRQSSFNIIVEGDRHFTIPDGFIGHVASDGQQAVVQISCAATPQPNVFRTRVVSALRLDNGELERLDNLENILTSTRHCFYSEANVSFFVPRIEHVRAISEPGERVITSQNVTRCTSNTTAEIAQLFVDIDNDDNAELNRWVRANRDQPVPEAILDRRKKKFQRAFERIFPHKKMIGIFNDGGAFKVTFEEGGRRSSLADLSTGEKQIVFRGAFLLRCLDDMPGSVILVDEPELSLHPTWQSRIMGFYEEIVGDDVENPGQIILATHSPFVVHGSIAAKHIVLKKENGGAGISTMSIPYYPTASAFDVAVSTFDIDAFVKSVSGKRLALIVEGKFDATIIAEAWSKLRPNVDCPFFTQAAGSAKVVQQLLGSDDGEAGLVLKALEKTGVARVAGLFDFDHEGYPQWNGTIKQQDA